MKIALRPQERLSVLIVDDEPDIREALVTFIEMMECFNFIVEAKDGQDAFLKYQNQDFDLVISDLIMPKSTGIDFIKNVQNHKNKVSNAKKTPTAILILSANITSEEVTKAMKLGVKYALTKPCRSDDFIKKVSEILIKEKKNKIKVLEL